LLIENTNIVTISHCSFINNRASNDGGVGNIRNATVSIRNSTFSNNRARGDGGVFAVDNSEITIYGSILINNSAGTNGGVFAVDNSEMTIYGSTFNNNTAETNGGVIAIKYLCSTLFIIHTSFTNNKGEQGGVMYLGRKGSRAKISRSTIGSNNASRGGFATVLGSSLEITTSNIFNNTADTGDVISACSSDISVSDQFTIGTDPVHSVCTLFSGNVNDIDLIEATTTEAQIEYTTTTKATLNVTTTSQPIDIDLIEATTTEAQIDTTTTRATTETTTSQPTQPASVYFELNGKAYPNNSVISLLEVGENQNALLCKTDLVSCCGTPPNRFGEFYYPSGEAVPVRGTEHGFYRDRGAQVVRLNRREGITSPTGKFHCAVPYASGTIQNLFIYLV
jgi:predicted outer membrane repeat protein